MSVITEILSNPGRLTNLARANGNGLRVSKQLTDSARLDAAEVLQQLNTGLNGLTQAEAENRLAEFGLNVVAKEKRLTLARRLWDNVKNPLVVLLVILGAVSYLTGDARAAIVIAAMVLLGIVLRFFQELRADNAAEKLRAMVTTTATVVREGQKREIALQELAPGDIVRLSAGDMVPADVRLVSAKDLFLNQAALTGESLPVEKTAGAVATAMNPLELPNVCFLGSNVESGAGTAVVVQTGSRTYFGSLASTLNGARQLTTFDRGINRFTWLMISFMLVMVPAVFLFNGLSKHNWLEAFLFALAVAVGLTPEMLPMIVTVNLSKGAIAMSRKKVIVKRLNAIQNFGAMDMLCTDKTGTLTEGRIVLEKHLDVSGNENETILHLRLSQQLLPDRAEEPARRGRAGARRAWKTGWSSAANTGRWTRSPSTSRASACRSWWISPAARAGSSAKARWRRSSVSVHAWK